MKRKIFIILTLFIISFFILYLLPEEGFKILKINSPLSIYIDLNKNYIFDEKTPVTIENIFYINKNTDYSNHPVFKNLSEEQKLFLEYKAFNITENLLKNKHVDLKNGEIYIKNHKYTDLIKESGFFYDESAKSQNNLLNNINNINLDDYVLYNPKNRKYHKLSCDACTKIKNYKIIKKEFLKPSDTPCKTCNLTFQNVSFIKHSAPDNKKTKSLCPSKKYYENKNIKVFFLDLNEIYKPSNKCDNIACKTLEKEIENSKHTIDFAVYGFNNQPEIFNALIKAKKRGVKIRWVFDISKSGEDYYKDNQKLADIITDYNTDEQYEQSNSSAIMHNKFFIFDSQKVFTGSANITTTDLSGFNANYAVLINSKELADIYKKEFEQMYNGIFHKYKNSHPKPQINIGNNIKITPLFSPQDDILHQKIIPLINNANKYIYMPMFFLSNKDTANALIKAKNRGVEIKIICDATNSHTKNSVHKLLRTYGIKVKTENFAGKMHMKSIIIDDKISSIGSMNYTNSGNNRNDENVLIIENKDIAIFLRNTFLYLWNKIPEKYEHFDPRAESFESVGSCYDGIDNNFDKKIDFMDDGCKAK